MEKPSIFFQLFITDELLGKIATWTNRWFKVKQQLEPNKHKTPFEPVTDIQELKAYFALLLAINQDIDMPHYEHYFRQNETKWLFLTPGFQRVFTMKRFSQLNRYVFFCNPDELDLENPTRTDKLVKIRPFVQHLQKVFKENFNCGKNFAIDEAMIPYKGKLSFKQRILGKPVRWGIKVFELCDSETACLSRFEVYLGKARDPEREDEQTSAIGKGGAVVARLTNDFHHKGHQLFTDNWYTSPALCLFLQSRGIYTCGTVRANRKGFPIELQQLKASALARGASQLRVFDGVVAMTWKDNKIVHFLSTIHSPDETSTILRQQRARGTGEYILAEIPSHKIVESYNANMGAVDTNDQMTIVRKSRKQMRWYMRCIVKGLELSAYDAYVIEGHFVDHNPAGRRKRDFLAFREDLILQMIDSWRAQRTRVGRKRKETPFRLENVGTHFPEKGQGSDHTCEVCREKYRRYKVSHGNCADRLNPCKRTKTTFKCSACDVYLCISREHDCFRTWHTQSEYFKWTGDFQTLQNTANLTFVSCFE